MRNWPASVFECLGRLDWRSSQSGSRWVQNFHLSRALRRKKGVVLTQVSCDELWEISFIDQLQEHVCCCMKQLLSPEEERWLISSWKNYVTSHLQLVWCTCSRYRVFSPVCLRCPANAAKQTPSCPQYPGQGSPEHHLSTCPKTLRDRCYWWQRSDFFSLTLVLFLICEDENDFNTFQASKSTIVGV